MRIVVLFNPISGTGRAAAVGEYVANLLRASGHTVAIAHTRPHSDPDKHWLDELLHDAELLVVSGGDGAVRMVSASAIRFDVPIYHLPFGTENLFAREFGMNREPSTLIRAVNRYEVRRVDTGLANGEQFLLMASVGFDAEVVHELAATRSGSISHLTYLAPIFNQLRRWRPSCLAVTVDGDRIDSGEPGFVVIANCKQYGWRLNPAARASMTDGLFDIAYFPARSRLDLITWAFRCRLQRHLNDRRLVYRQGRSVTVACAGNCRYQLDGDPSGERGLPGCHSADFSRAYPLLNAEMIPKSLPVLIP